ncbi:DUF4810 domain-containing protein [Paraburkholderia strydomiana]|uniref:DUF4810 domain-containing protein n=1 Tax=Paraburkholderia strydomiana TaxID=1245417 RepID=UPI0020358E0A|nr:DUF4810 domain-containing protein [Paraburkholderia strydomiana]
MKYTGMLRGLRLPVTTAMLLLAGCANTTPPLYQWTGYQPSVYDYLKGERGPQEQIDALEKARQQISAKGNTPPPGFHAQLGMLYANVGNDTNAMQEFDAEKQLFPEAATYMDFLMKKPKQQ